MMKKTFLLLLLAALPLMVSAQNAMKFAYFNYNEVLKAMPEYAAATHKVDELRAKFDAETKRKTISTPNTRISLKVSAALHPQY